MRLGYNWNSYCNAVICALFVPWHCSLWSFFFKVGPRNRKSSFIGSRCAIENRAAWQIRNFSLFPTEHFVTYKVGVGQEVGKLDWPWNNALLFPLFLYIFRVIILSKTTLSQDIYIYIGGKIINPFFLLFFFNFQLRATFDLKSIEFQFPALSNGLWLYIYSLVKKLHATSTFAFASSIVRRNFN